MIKNLTKCLLLMVVTSLLTFVVASANPQIYRISAYINNELKFTFNGESVQLKDVNGKKVNPIVYDGSTYLPVRAIAELTGLSVDYDNSSKTIIIEEDMNGAVPYNDGKDTGKEDTKDNSPKGAVIAPHLESKLSDGKLVLQWNKVNDPRLQGYKVVISKSDFSPVYPENGYLFWITDKNQTSAVIDNSSQYNGGDFGEYLKPGETYYFSITVIYDGGKVSSNTLKLTYPSE